MRWQFPFFILGFVGTFGVAAGRALCGWACPFGFLQDGLYRIPSPKRRLPRLFNALKYALLAGLVIGLPLVLHSDEKRTASERISGEAGARDYCSTICPAGSLEAAVPYLIYSGEVRAKANWWSWTKVGIMAVILGGVVVYRRSFCRALCPLGALMALFSRVSLLQLKTEQSKCTRCMKCVTVCPTVCRHVPNAPGGKEATAECVLCLDCVRNCPEEGALMAQFGGKTVSVSQRRSSDS